MAAGLQVYLFTDLEQIFVMDSDIEMEDLVAAGILRVEQPGGCVLLGLNDILRSLLEGLEVVVEPRSGEAVYRDLAKMNEERTACTRAEAKVLGLLRQPGDRKLTIHMTKGRVKRIDIERDVTSAVADQNSDTTRVRHESAHETVKLTRHANRITRATRTQPMPIPGEDSRRVYFTGPARGSSRKQESK
jgi:hypothetical protein